MSGAIGGARRRGRIVLLACKEPGFPGRKSLRPPLLPLAFRSSGDFSGGQGFCPARWLERAPMRARRKPYNPTEVPAKLPPRG
ncbi:MAG: hypothetical protein WCD86_17330 [Ktedonobacteraceae bacterium]